MAESRTQGDRPTSPGEWIVVDTGCIRNYLCCRSCALNYHNGRPSDSTPDINGNATQESHLATDFTVTSNSSPEGTHNPSSGLDEFKFTFHAPVYRSPDPTCFSENCWVNFCLRERFMHQNDGNVRFNVLVMCRVASWFDDPLVGDPYIFPHGRPPPSLHSPPALEYSSSDEEYQSAHEDEDSPASPPSDEQYYMTHEDEVSSGPPPSDEEYHTAHEDEDSPASPQSDEEYLSALEA